MSTPIRIAIADDHAIFREGLIAFATKHGFEVIIAASNGQDLVDALNIASTQPDVCILDINMPVMNGYATAAAIKSKWPKIHVLALSMHNTELPIIKMLRAGAGGYLLKDGQPEELQLAISAVIENGFYHSEAIGDTAKKALATGNKDSAPKITDKEIRFLSWCCCDLGYKEIAQRMDISTRTVESYADILCNKIGVRSRIGLVTAALSMGLEPAE